MGKIIHIDNCTLINGDCLELMKEIPEGSIDLILTDCPYGTTACNWDIVIPLDLMWSNIKRVRRTVAPTVLFGSEPFSSNLRISNLKEFKYDWIWDKRKGTGFLNAKKQPLRYHEIISVFYEKQCLYVPQKTFGHNRKSTLRKGGMNTDVYGNMDKDNLYDSTERYPRSILEFSTDTQKSSLHPTQKPVALLEYLIKTYTNEGDTVLDFTAGSFSTAIACVNTNRKFIGIELDENYFDIGVNRVKDHMRYINSRLFK